MTAPETAVADSTRCWYMGIRNPLGFAKGLIKTGRKCIRALNLLRGK